VDECVVLMNQMNQMNQMNKIIFFFVVIFSWLVCTETGLLLPLNLNRKNSWIPKRFLDDGRAKHEYHSFNTKTMCTMNQMNAKERFTGALSKMLMVGCSDFILGMPVPVFFFLGLGYIFKAEYWVYSLQNRTSMVNFL